MKIIFFGSDDFALTHLEALNDAGVQVVACVTQPDKAKGRGLKASVSPIKEFAKAHKIPILQPLDFKNADIISDLKKYQADLFVVIAYGKILPETVLKIPKIFAINVHGSLLPKYRGAAPINWAIINGDRETGVTIIKMSPGMDAGEIIAQEKMPINDEDTSQTLRARMANIGSAFLVKTIFQIFSGEYEFKKQDLSGVTFAPKLTKALGKIDWPQKALTIHNLIRGLLPWPSAYTYYKGKVLKILSTEIMDQAFTDKKAGQIVGITKHGFVVATGQQNLLIKEVHLESSKPMDAYSFAMGQRLEEGFIFK